MDGIFISYRRDDSAGYAGRLYDRLAAHFGPSRVFMDVEGIEPGLDFVVAIEEAVSSCQVLIVIIGDEWTHGTDAAGRRRLDDPNDFIRLETGTALKRSIRVVPVLVGGAVMPLTDELPEELKSLTRRQAIEINHKQWDASSGELIRTLEGILKAPAAAAEVPTPPAAPKVAQASPVVRADASRSEKDESRRWALPAAAVVAALAAVGLWAALGERKSTEPGVAEQSREEVASPAATPGSGTSATTATETVAAASTPPAAPAPIPVPLPAPAPAPSPAPVVQPAPTPSPAPAPTPTPTPAPPTIAVPVINEFNADAAASRARLCYRVSDADSLTLSPRPGELDKTEQDCVLVALDARTVFTLTARNGSKTTRKKLTVAPIAPEAPVVAATPARETSPALAQAPAVAVVPAATPATPAAVAVPAAASTTPMKGERWAYRSSGKWPTSPKRRFEVVAQSVAGEVVTDALNVLEPASAAGSEVRRSRGAKPDFVTWNLIGQEFSPYFGAFVALSQQGSLSGLPTPDLDTQWTGWTSQAKVLGQESVTVPAGTFNAHKVEVWSSRARSGTPAEANIEPVRVQFLIWYAPQAKRYVRMQRRITTAGNSESEKDVFELVAHRAP